MDLTLTHVLLMIGVAVLAPLTLRLHPGLGRSRMRVVIPAGGLAAVSLIVPAGTAAGVLAVPWAGMALGMAVAAVPRTVRAMRSGSDGADAGAPVVVGLRAVAPLAALAFWVVGAGWLLLDRLAVDPVGVGPDLVLLTAVHFHYAGLAATTIVAASATPTRRGLVALVGTMLAPVLIAVGFVAVPVLQVLGAAVFTVALLTWSLQAGGLGGGLAGGLWLLARLSVWVSMPLAVWWATGFVTGLPAPSIPTMAATHGVANAFGFTLAGVIALHQGRPSVAAAG